MDNNDILSYKFIDSENNKKIKCIVSGEDVKKNGGLSFYCNFYDEKGNSLGGSAGYLKKDEWPPILLCAIEEIYYEAKKEGWIKLPK